MNKKTRSFKDLIELDSSFREKGFEFVGLKGLKYGIDTGRATCCFPSVNYKTHTGIFSLNSPAYGLIIPKKTKNNISTPYTARINL